MTTAAARILLCCDEPDAVAELRPLLEQAGHAVVLYSPDTVNPPSPCDLVLLDAGARPEAALRRCQRLRGLLADTLVPVVFLTSDASPGLRLAGLQAGADACLSRPFAPEELLAQVRAFLRLKLAHDRLEEKGREAQRVNERLQQAYRRIDQELALARRVQQSFLPKSLPELPAARLAVHYRPRGQVGGDFYDAFRLDEHHLGFYVADAMGHGLPASLLTIYLKKGVQPKEISGRQYRLVSPDEVLRQLNRDLIAQALADVPFITMVYGLFDARTRTLALARAGHPHPLWLPRAGPAEFWQVPGALLGFFETSFTVQTRRLRPGDRVLFYTDGLEASDAAEPGNYGPLLAAAQRHRALSAAELVERLAAELAGPGEREDDFTLLALEVGGRVRLSGPSTVLSGIPPPGAGPVPASKTAVPPASACTC